MKNSISFLVSGVSLVGACLFSSCASNSKKCDSCCSAGSGAPVAAPAASSKATAAAPGATQAARGAAAPASASAKVREHVTNSTQIEIVRETKPVIGDDSELRR